MSVSPYLSSKKSSLHPPALELLVPSFELWKKHLRVLIDIIAKSDPERAEYLSRRVLLFKGHLDEKEELRSLGLPVPVYFAPSGLPGGMFADEAKSLAVELIKGAVEFVVNGNKKEMSTLAASDFLDSKICLPNGEWVEGHHQGARVLSKPHYSFRSLGFKRYGLLACGEGQFISTRAMYKGIFVNNLFHDLTGSAEYFIEGNLRYRGCFENGRRSKHGTLERYHPESGKFYECYRGTWKNDQPESGSFFSPEGEEIAVLREGVHDKVPLFDAGKSSHPTLPTATQLPPLNQTKKTSSSSSSSRESNIKSSPRLPALPCASPAENGGLSTSSFDNFPPISKPSSKMPPSSSPPPSSSASSSLKANIDPTKSPEEACPLIGQKLANPQMVLSLDESIELLTTCIAYGSLRAEQIEGREAIIVIGNTGAGKSTSVNYLAGCSMALKSPKSLGIKGLKSVVVVRPPSEGGALEALMRTGHSKQSMTFMPDIRQAPTQHTYCDCPGFLDNRGEEINIANAVNVRNALMKAGQVKVLVLINYHTLEADRGRGLNDMLKICSNLFGSSENLERYAPSLLVGITQLPSEMELSSIKEWLIEDTPPIMQTLSERLFIFDPLDRPFAEGGWDRSRCLSEIDALPSIDNPASIFKTVLTDSDEKKLVAISEQMGEDIKQGLEAKDYALAASRLHHLQSLSVIEHFTVNRLLNQNFYTIGRHFQKTQDDFKDRCHFDNFLAADVLLQELTGAVATFGAQLKEVIEIDKLQDFYSQAKKRYEARKAQDERQEQALKEARGQIEKLLELLEEQKKGTLEQLQRLERLHQERQEALSLQVSSIQEAYSHMQEELEEERKARLEEKEKELSLARSLGQKDTEEAMNKEKRKLEEEYRRKLEKAQAEKEALLQEQRAIQEQHQRALAAEQNKLQEKLQAIETQKASKEKTLKTASYPRLAFGPEDWSRYFGEVDEVPPLPNNIEEILKGPCPYFEGQKVEDSHLLVLMPRTINGAPFTLNSLGELIQNPQGGGHRTKYRYYWDKLKEQKGKKGISKPYWLLLTKDVIPNSRDKNFADQQKLIKRGYSVPKALEVTTALLMHHVRSGERLCSDNPYTYTRCEEKFDVTRVCVGGFAPSGLNLNYHYDSYDGCNDYDVSSGLLLSRKFLGP